MHASVRRNPISAARRIAASAVLGSFALFWLIPGIAHSLDSGGSLSAPPPELSVDEEKSAKQARKAARKQEEEAEETGEKIRDGETADVASSPAADAAEQPAPAASATTPAPQPEGSASNAAAEQVILEVFGPQLGPTALRVARCESSMATGARNGSYAGLFQMGSYERSTYGHGDDPRAQAQAAYSYFATAGWRPWSASRRCWAA